MSALALDFNTTIVSVRVSDEELENEALDYFNTTIVSVRGPLLMFEADNIRYFNTTIVSVRASLGFVPVPLLSLFQYNDCVGSRVSRIVFSSLLHNFNTTIVSVRVRKSSI